MSELHDFLAAHSGLFKDFAGWVATALGFIATSIFAVIGLRTFDKWKREKIEERRIEVALDALAIVLITVVAAQFGAAFAEDLVGQASVIDADTIEIRY